MGDAHRGSPRSDRRAAGARSGSLRSRQGEGAHCRVPGGAEAEGAAGGRARAAERRAAADQRADSLLRRSARRRQDVARPVDRARDEPQVRAHLARRRARRSGDPRAPPHLHRRDSGTHRAGAEAGRRDQPRVHARRDRQDHERRLPGRSRRGAARSARPGAEPFVPRSLSRDQRRSLARAVHRHREPARDDPSGAARSDGDHLPRRLHRGREAAHRAALSDSAAARGERAHTRHGDDRGRRRRPDDRAVHARGRRARPRAADRRRGAQGRGARRRRHPRAGGRRGRWPADGVGGEPHRVPRAAEGSRRGELPRVAAGRRDRPRVDRIGRRCATSAPRRRRSAWPQIF